MPSTTKQAETTAYEAVQTTPITQVHGQPMRSNYKTLKSNASALASKVKDITYVCSKSTMDNYGLLSDIFGFNEHYKLTGISTYTIPAAPVLYDPSINNMTPTHEQRRKEEDWDLIHAAWIIRKGFLRGIVDNLCDALNEQYYSQLKHRLKAYCNPTPFQILEHLNNRWCPLHVKTKKALKDAYYTDWDGDDHLIAFGKRLDDNQCALVSSNITIADKDKLQLYLEEMHNSNHFNKK
jgi:hypothetical protein